MRAAPSTREIRTMYAYLAVFAYLLYGVGYVTPYLRADLRLSDFSAGLHATALAIGTLLAGLLTGAMGRRLGSRLSPLAVALCGLAALLIVLAPALPVSLCGAALVGLAGGLLTIHVNIALGGTGDALGRKLLARANAWAMASAVAAPLVVAFAASVAHAWRLAVVAAMVGLVAVSILSPRSTRTAAPPRTSGRLPRRFWPAWIFVVLAVSIEFSFVFWSSTLIAQRTGASTDTSTFVASFFVVGMFGGRAALGVAWTAAQPPRLLVPAGLAIAVTGAAIAWISTQPVFSAVGVFAGGAGTGVLYPLGVAVAFTAAAGSEVVASARLTLASGLAIFAAPSLLGLAGDAVGVVAAWPIVFVCAAAALLLGLVATRDASGPTGYPATDASAGTSNNPATDKYRSPVS